MRTGPFQLPWTLENVPHAILDILRGCNIRCRDCYNSQPDHLKPLAEIDAQLDALTRLRRLHSVSIVGGEITLHPNLVEIVRRVRQRGLYVELFTNGVELTQHLLAELKQAGANVVFLHIEPHQHRPDLPPNATPEELRQLRAEKTALVAAQGIQVGLVVTAYPEHPEEIQEAVAFALESPDICYLLVTWWRDINRMPPIRGSLETGMFAETPLSGSTEEVDRKEVEKALAAKFGLQPFGFLGSNLDATDTRWLSYMLGTVYPPGAPPVHRSLQPTWVEKTFLDWSRKLTGRYPFHQPQHAGRFAFHLLLNGLAGGGLTGHLNLLKQAGRPGARLRAKRFLFQRPAAIDSLGRVIHCHCCPDAVLKEGRLVPLCISDRVAPGHPTSAGRRKGS